MKKMKISFNAPVTLCFIIICTISICVNFISAGYSNAFLFSIYRSSPSDFLSYIRIVGHVFGHSGMNHFIGNMSYILLLGPLLEEKYGKWVMIDVVLITAIVSGLINIIIFPNTSLLGASGVVFAFIMLSSITSLKEGTIPLTFLIMAIFYMGNEIYSGIFLSDNVSNLTHIIGGIVGSVLGYKLGIKKSKKVTRYNE